MASAQRPTMLDTRPIRSEYDACDALKPRRTLPTVRRNPRECVAEFIVGMSVGTVFGLALGVIWMVAVYAR